MLNHSDDTLKLSPVLRSHFLHMPLTIISIGAVHAVAYEELYIGFSGTLR